MNFENRLKSVVLTNHNDSRYSYINYFKKVMSGDTNEYRENLEEKFYNIIDSELNKFAVKNGVTCNYVPFAFVVKDNEKNES